MCLSDDFKSQYVIVADGKIEKPKHKGRRIAHEIDVLIRKGLIRMDS